jgi:hypothetical protein
VTAGSPQRVGRGGCVASRPPRAGNPGPRIRATRCEGGTARAACPYTRPAFAAALARECDPFRPFEIMNMKTPHAAMAGSVITRAGLDGVGWRGRGRPASGWRAAPTCRAPAPSAPPPRWRGSRPAGVRSGLAAVASSSGSGVRRSQATRRQLVLFWSPMARIATCRRDRRRRDGEDERRGCGRRERAVNIF